MGLNIVTTHESHRQWKGTSTYSGPANSGEPITVRGNIFAGATATLQAFGAPIQFLSDLGNHHDFNAYCFDSSERPDGEWRADAVTIASHIPPVDKDPGKVFMLSAVLIDDPVILLQNEQAAKDEEKKRVSVIPIEAWLFDLQYKPNINTPAKLVIAHLKAGLGKKSNTYLESQTILRMTWNTERNRTTIGLDYQDNSQAEIRDMDRIMLSQAKVAHPFLTQYLQSMFHVHGALHSVSTGDFSLTKQKAFTLWGSGHVQSEVAICLPTLVRNV